MGRSITCNYHCTAYYSTGENWIFGAMSLKEAYAMGKSFNGALNKKGKNQLVKIVVFAQTARGERTMKKDYLIIDAWNHRDHYAMTDAIPFYTF